MTRVRTRLALTAVLLAVAGAGCGTRVQEDAASVPAQVSGSTSGPSADVAAPGGVAESGTEPHAAAVGDPSGQRGADPAAPAPPGAGAAAGRAAGARDQNTGSAATGAAGNPRAAPSGGGPSTRSTGSPGPQPGASSAGAATPKVPAPAPGGSPVLVANVGTYSGPAAATLKPNVDGVQLWVRSVNQRGGLNGHEVKLLVYDDAGDPARHRAQVQEAVEQKKVLAFVGNAEALTGPSTSDYLLEKRVPVVGVDGGWDFPYQNPMYFLQVSSGTAFVTTFILSTAQLAVPAGKTRLGLLACAEAQACADADRIFPDRAKGLGLDLVYKGRASIAQPDFTAECLAARNAGVQTFFVMMDGNSVGRIGNSCARQGFKPQFASASSIILDRFKTDPNLDGLYGSNQTFPYFQDSTPATAEFQQALKAFGGGVTLGSGVAVGWTAGKLLERAGQAMPEPPTTEAILRGLWSIKNDTLGGLTYPLTFTEGKPSERKLCWFNVQVLNGKWTSPDGNKLSCGE
jgi:branched-chain amino acid transport system substrate-binding protein